MDRETILASALRAIVRNEVEDAEQAKWLRFATARVNRELRIAEMTKHSVLPLTANTFVAPDDYLQFRSLTLNVNTLPTITVGPARGALIYAPPAQMAAYAANPQLRGSVPGYFTSLGKNFEIVPWAVSPDQYQIAMWYYAKVPNLGDADNATNWLVSEYENLFLNAVLIYAFAYTLEEERSLAYEALVRDEISTLNTKHQEAKYGEGPLVAAPTRKMGGRRS